MTRRGFFGLLAGLAALPFGRRKPELRQGTVAHGGMVFGWNEVDIKRGVLTPGEIQRIRQRFEAQFQGPVRDWPSKPFIGPAPS